MAAFLVRRGGNPASSSRLTDKQNDSQFFIPQFFNSLLVDKLFPLLEDPNAEVFFGDEAGGDTRPRQKWVRRGLNPTIGYYGGHDRSNVVGAVSPRSGQLVSLIVPYCDQLVFEQFLDTLAEEVPKALE